MAIRRKELVKERIEKNETLGPEPVKLKRSFKIDGLPDVIIEGKFIAKIGDEIVVVRALNGRKNFSVCVVKNISENGLIETWDNTVQQWFVFNVSEKLPMMKLFNTT